MRQRDHKCEIINERTAAGGRIGSYQRVAVRKAPKNSGTARDDGVKISKRLQNWQEEARESAGKRRARGVFRQGLKKRLSMHQPIRAVGF